MFNYIKTLLSTDNNHHVFVGDMNIAPHENDVWSHKQLLNVVSHTDIERKKLLMKSLIIIIYLMLCDILLMMKKKFILGGVIEIVIGENQTEEEDWTIYGLSPI